MEIHLDKNPRVRPIGIGEYGAAAEAEIHAMREIYQQEDIDAVLLIDSRNAFNCLNRSVALHNIEITCPILAMYLINTY